MHKKHKSHTFRNVFLSILALLIFGTAAFGMSHYRSVKAAINSSFAPSGVDKSRNVSSILKKKTPVSILLMGTDNGASGRNYTGRTDSMMVVTIDPKTRKTSITSIPRDVAVVVPGYKGKSPAKIDAAYSYGQAKTAVTTVSKLLNVPIDFYALINLEGMEDVIDQVGGVDVYEQGEKTHMDGAKAIDYVNNADNDYGRQLRQFDVLSAILHKSDSISTLLNQSFFNSMAEQTQTDLTFADLNVLAKNYFYNGETNQTHLKGTAAKVAGQSMQIVKDSELQRVTNFIRDNLNLGHVKTGKISYQKGEKITEPAKKKAKKKVTKKKTKKESTKKETTDSDTSDTDNGTANSAASDTTGTTSSATGSSSTAGSGSTGNSAGSTSSYGGNSSSGTSSNTGSSYGSGSSTGNSGSSANSGYYGGGSSSNTGSSSSTAGSGSGSSSSNSGESSYGGGSSSASTDSSSSDVNNGYASSGYGE